MRERILLVEDNEINLKLLTFVLKPYGYEILTAASGNEALEMVNRMEPDLILLDIRLPDISGFDICEILKGHKETKHIPIIFTTAMAQKEHRIRGLELGAADFITKPFFQEEIILRVKNQLKLKRTEKQLKETIEDQRLLLDHIDQMVWYLEDPETLGKVNYSFAAFFNQKKEDLENISIEKIMPPEELSECLQGNKQVFETREKIQQKHIHTNGSGEQRLLEVTKVPQINKQGNVVYVICSAEDITERHRKEEEIRYLTFHDALTGLYNRTFYEEELKRLDVQRNLPLSMIACDVNGLKLTNDIFGHQTGDLLLVEVANILKTATRESDIIARWGGDEFVILLPNTNQEEALRITERIKSLMEGRTVEMIPVSIALGAATKEDVEEDTKQILKKAEDRMYRNKTATKEQQNRTLLDRFMEIYYGPEYRDIRHTSKIQEYGSDLAEALELNKEQQERLDLLIRYHDIGKISVPKEVLNKEKALTDEEWELYKGHVEIGYRIAKIIPNISAIAEELHHHHERVDGKGFPTKLPGREIPYLAKVLAVLDFYDSLRCGIPYPLGQKRCIKKVLTDEEAIKELQKHSGTYFDPEIVKVFTERVAA